MSRLRLAVDFTGSINLVATLTKYLSLATLVPATVAVGYGESPWPFLAAGAIVGGISLAVELLTRGEHRIGSREAFFVVSFTWLVAAALGALPYILSAEPELNRPIDAYFEAMSGFTTTGASVITDIEAVSHSILIWRQFTQWLGGIGIIVLALAVLPRLRVGGRQLLEHEMPGPEIESLSTRVRDTARRVWFLYVALTAILVSVLIAFELTGIDDRMTIFDAFAHALTTMPTGGFGTDATSLAEFGAATQWTIVLFMLLAGANFALLYRAFVRRQPKAFALDENLADAYAVQGFLRIFHHRDWAGAEASLQNALALDAGNVNARHWLAIFYSIHRRLDEAKAEMQKALELDPTNLEAHRGLASIWEWRALAATMDMTAAISLDDVALAQSQALWRQDPERRITALRAHGEAIFEWRILAGELRVSDSETAVGIADAYSQRHSFLYLPLYEMQRAGDTASMNDYGARLLADGQEIRAWTAQVLADASSATRLQRLRASEILLGALEREWSWFSFYALDTDLASNVAQEFGVAVHHRDVLVLDDADLYMVHVRLCLDQTQGIFHDLAGVKELKVHLRGARII